jgi:hypothetical protein
LMCFGVTLPVIFTKSNTSSFAFDFVALRRSVG